MRGDAEARLKAGWTPERIGERARLEGHPWVSKETIYKHIYADARAGGTLVSGMDDAEGEEGRLPSTRCPTRSPVSE